MFTKYRRSQGVVEKTATKKGKSGKIGKKKGKFNSIHIIEL